MGDMDRGAAQKPCMKIVYKSNKERKRNKVSMREIEWKFIRLFMANKSLKLSFELETYGRVYIQYVFFYLYHGKWNYMKWISLKTKERKKEGVSVIKACSSTSLSDLTECVWCVYKVWKWVRAEKMINWKHFDWCKIEYTLHFRTYARTIEHIACS